MLSGVKRPSRSKIEALDTLVAEATALSHRFRSVAAQSHGDAAVTGGMREVLILVERDGPQTVPRIARARPASRQHIQSLVNKLLDLGLVELIDNPAHKRSRQVRITANGRQKLTELDDQERMMFTNVRIRVSKKELRHAAQTLRAVREFFESPAWQETAPSRANDGSGKPAVGFREQRVRLFEP